MSRTVARSGRRERIAQPHRDAIPHADRELRMRDALDRHARRRRRRPVIDDREEERRDEHEPGERDEHRRDRRERQRKRRDQDQREKARARQRERRETIQRGHVETREHALAHRVRVQPLDLGLGFQHEAMAQRGGREGLHIVGRDEVAAVDRRAAFAARSRWTPARGLAPRMRSGERRDSAAMRDDVVEHRVLDRHALDLARHSSSVPCAKGSTSTIRAEGWPLSCARRIARSSSALGIADDRLEQEAVELGLGQRDTCPRTRRGSASRGRGTGRAARSDSPSSVTCRSSIASSSARLRLRRRAVDLIREHDVREDGPGPHAERARRDLVDVRAHDVARHEVGRELDAFERPADESRDAFALEAFSLCRARLRSEGGRAAGAR